VIFVDEFPLTHLGKIDRSALRAMAPGDDSDSLV